MCQGSFRLTRSVRSTDRDKTQTGQIEAEFLEKIDARECYLGRPVAEQARFVVHQRVEQGQTLQAKSGRANFPFSRVKQYVGWRTRDGVQ